jgi:hypothetical protein
MRRLLASCGHLVVLALLACGGPTAAGSPSTPALSVNIGSAAPPSAPAPASSAKATAPAPSACAGKCTGHVGNALLEEIAKRAKTSHRCYDNALASDKTVRGKVTVRFTVGVDGSVCDVSAESDNTAMDAVASCVAALYRKNTGDLRFPAPDDGCVTVKLPVNFVPRPDDAGAP